MLAAVRLCSARQQQACSLLPNLQSRLFALARKPQHSGLKIACGSDFQRNSRLVLKAKHDGCIRTLAEEHNILAVEASDWQHPASQRTFIRTAEQPDLPRPTKAKLTHATDGADSVFQRTISKPWTCANAPRYIVATLAEWEDRGVRDTQDAQEWLVDKLNLRGLSQSSIRTYFTAHGIQEICRVLCLVISRTKEHNLATLKSALSETKPATHRPSYNTLQLAS